MALLRDMFWIAGLLVITAVVTFNGLSHSVNWNAAKFAPVAVPSPAMEAHADVEPPVTPTEADGTTEDRPVTLAQMPR